ncbi:hypothetical protein QYE76_003624 [Lolium multiflorum]|uniref:Uncharacterized protein n=1 Tax=Lolium multiflorum TaxID=4521 RepID=A0AAD8RQW0_LOLMU|nr:hypothetical protein QYE76_003624 [Lolium multiflorum]
MPPSKLTIAMDVATGAMGALLPKMVELLKTEYRLEAGLREDVQFLEWEMRSMDAALRKVARVRREQLDDQVKIWADDVKELSYEMEDVVDRFLIRADDSPDPDSFVAFVRKVVSLFKKRKAARHIADAIKEIKEQVHEVASRRDRYNFDHIDLERPISIATFDPRMPALFKDKRGIIGLGGPTNELIEKLTGNNDGVSNDNQTLKKLSIFGFGGLGKTTLAKVFYDNLQGFARKAFVSVGQDPDVKKVLIDILLQLDEGSCSNVTMLDEWQLIRKLRGLLDGTRYLIVVDDLWSIKSWEIISCAWVDNHCGSVIITTTRIQEVAEEVGNVYKHQPLSSDNSRELFKTRLAVGKGKISYENSAEITEKILRKCDGVPLAIIAIASLLAGKPIEDWPKVYNSIGFGHGHSIHIDNTRNILLLSYYDLPCHLRTCLLYLGLFPADSEIEKYALIWKWIAEGFVHEKYGMGLFASGESCFDELINRCLIQPVKLPHEEFIHACRVHDLVLDMILSLSKQENFVAAFHGNEQSSFSQSKPRRLAIIRKRFSREHQEQVPHLANIQMQKVRSFLATTCHLRTMPSLSSFQVLRVLALKGCTFSEDRPYDLANLGRLPHLRYLGISDTPINDLPTEIGDLKFLQTLNLIETGIHELPQSVSLLGQLKCLRFKGMVSDWIGNLISLEELSYVNFHPSSVKQLVKLTELREFRAQFEEFNDESFKFLMDSVGYMQKLQSIQIDSIYSWNVGLLLQWEGCEGYVPPPDLRRVALYGVVFPRLPAWISSSLLPHLTQLSVMLKVVEVQGLKILGRFSELTTLNLSIGYHDGIEIADLVIGVGAFPRLTCLYTNATLTFLQGAMPSLERVFYWLKTPEAVHHTYANIESLPSLEEVTVFVKCASDSAFFMEAKAVCMHAFKDHPNKPESYLSTF